MDEGEGRTGLQQLERAQMERGRTVTGTKCRMGWPHELITGRSEECRSGVGPESGVGRRAGLRRGELDRCGGKTGPGPAAGHGGEGLLIYLRGWDCTGRDRAWRCALKIRMKAGREVEMMRVQSHFIGKGRNFILLSQRTACFIVRRND